MITWTHISRLGEFTFMSLVAFAIAIWLFAEGEKRMALWWSALFAAGMGVVTITKMAFIGWGIGIRPLDFTGFSGHAMRAAAVYPVLLWLLLQKAPSPLRAAGVLLGFAFATTIGISRLALHAHSISEVMAGLMLGGAVCVAFIRMAGSSGALDKHVCNPLRIALGVLMLLPAPYLGPAPTQQWLTEMSLYFAGHDKPFMRARGKEARPPAPDQAQF
jgi:membrane-associated phospholipid phosphatase